jgi:RecB family exonuclease
VRGGAGVLNKQSQCPFQAFASVRLAAETWNPAEVALTAAERGQILHEALRRVWGGAPDGLRTLDELRALADPAAFVAGHVREAITRIAPPRVREQLGRRVLELEEIRLTRLLTKWLSYEATRASFSVVSTELKERTSVAGLDLDLRLDRLDRLSDGTVLVIDYKTGNVSTRAWELPRPEDLQLPLYARFGLAPGEILGGLVFAKVRAGDMCFAGRAGAAETTLLPSLGKMTSLVKNRMDAAELLDWEDKINELAREFLNGGAAVDPIDPPKTCERCGLYTLCRIKDGELTTIGEEAETEESDE